MLFSLDHKLYASDYNSGSDSDSDSVTSENQPSAQEADEIQASIVDIRQI